MRKNRYANFRLGRRVSVKLILVAEQILAYRDALVRVKIVILAILDKN